MYQLSEYFGDMRVKVSTQTVYHTGAVQVLSPDPRRAALIVGNFSGGPVEMATYGGFAQGTAQLAIANESNLILLWRDVGVLVTYEWWAMCITTDGNVTLTEVFWEPGGSQC